MNNQPRVFVASVAANNAGYPYGDWISAKMPEWKMRSEIETILKLSPVLGDDWAVYGYDNMPDLGEKPTIEQIIRVAEKI